MNFIPAPIDEQLRLSASTTNTASQNTTWYDLGKTFAPEGLGMPVAGVVGVSTCDRVSGNEAYSFQLEEADADASGVVDESTLRAIGVAAVVPTSIDNTNGGIVVAKGFLTGRFARLKMVASGTTPSITWDSHLTM